MEISYLTILVNKNKDEILIEENTSPIRDSQGNVLGAVIVFRDVSEKQKVEEEINKIQKLESLGILAGGIAHDFNNILTAIMGNISLSRLKLGKEDEIHILLTEAEKACWRARELTQQLLTFSKGGSPVKTTQDIKEIIQSTTEFSIHGTNIKVTYDFDKQLPFIDIDTGQINQVIQNLVINAREAMPDGGNINIKVENVVLEKNHKLNLIFDELELIPGNYIKITIRDEGEGIDTKYLKKIFDPYFTTKKQGSGLGLAIAYSIIKKHEGYIDVESSRNKGTSFYLYLPASSKVPEKTYESFEKRLNRNYKILVMDDEEIILEMMGKIFQTIGYEGTYVLNGADAIKQYTEHFQANDPFDLVILDLTIPGDMGGKEVAQKISKINPSAKIILSSGYNTSPVFSEYQKLGFSGIIIKPFNVEELTNEINRVLSE